MPDGLLPVVQKAYDLTRWLLPVVEGFPRKFKFTLGDRLQTTALDLCLALVEASHARAADRPLYRADRLLDQLRLLARKIHREARMARPGTAAALLCTLGRSPREAMLGRKTAMVNFLGSPAWRTSCASCRCGATSA